MRLRILIAPLAIATSILALASPAALAVKQNAPSGCRIAINVAPHLIETGESAVVFGRLRCPGQRGKAVAARTVHLLSRSLGGLAGFRFANTTTTDADGYYELLVNSLENNTAFYATSMGARSATVTVHVLAHVTLQGPPDGSQILTGFPHRVTFTGTVSPKDIGAEVVLQRQNAVSGNEWRRIDLGTVQPGGSYSITHTFVVPGDANIRVLVRSQRRNVPSPSSLYTYEISQNENPLLTINAVADPITFGEQVTISGTVTGEPGVPVTLLAHTATQQFAPVAEVKADGSGNYTMPLQVPGANTFYEVRAAGRTSAIVFEGVHDLLTAAISTTTINAGQPLRFSGAVAPDHSGHVIYLETQDRFSSEFHVVQTAYVDPGSVYTIEHAVYAPGTHVFRVRIPGGPDNEGAVSTPFTVTVKPVAPAALKPEAPGNSTIPPEGEG